MTTSRTTATVSRRTALAGLGAGALGLGLATRHVGHAAAQDATARPALVGSWKGLTTPAERPPIATLTTFISDGTLIQTSSDHPTRSPAHGAWEQTGDRDYAFTLERLNFDEAGALTQTQKGRARVTVDEAGDAYRGEVLSSFFDLAGTLVREGPPSGLQATRLVVEPMPAAIGTPEATPAA